MLNNYYHELQKFTNDITDTLGKLDKMTDTVEDINDTLNQSELTENLGELLNFL